MGEIQDHLTFLAKKIFGKIAINASIFSFLAW
jgi:hypothetical protein